MEEETQRFGNLPKATQLAEHEAQEPRSLWASPLCALLPLKSPESPSRSPGFTVFGETDHMIHSPQYSQNGQHKEAKIKRRTSRTQTFWSEWDLSYLVHPFVLHVRSQTCPEKDAIAKVYMGSWPCPSFGPQSALLKKGLAPMLLWWVTRLAPSQGQRVP